MRGEGARWSRLALSLALAAACAEGADTDPATTFGPSPASGNPPPDATTGEEPDDGTTMVPGEEGEAAEGFTTSGPPDDDGTTGSLDDGTTDGGDTSNDDGPPQNCADPGMCVGATPIGGVSGDTASGSLDANGTQPAWVTFQVSEDDSSLEGAAMSFTVLLTSPPGVDFDLFVYRGIEGAGSGCGGFMQSSTNGGGPDEVEMNWGEALVANGIDDGVWVAVEIVPKNDTCAPGSQWTLLVQGNT